MTHNESDGQSSRESNRNSKQRHRTDADLGEPESDLPSTEFNLTRANLLRGAPRHRAVYRLRSSCWPQHCPVA